MMQSDHAEEVKMIEYIYTPLPGEGSNVPDRTVYIWRNGSLFAGVRDEDEARAIVEALNAAQQRIVALEAVLSGLVDENRRDALYDQRLKLMVEHAEALLAQKPKKNVAETDERSVA